MTRSALSVSLSAFLAISLLAAGCAQDAPASVLEQTERYPDTAALPAPDLTSETSLEEALRLRRSQRVYAAEALSLDVLGQLLWAAQGITDSAGHRTAPSAGALYPLELYVLTESVFMHYEPDGHRVEQRSDGESKSELASAAFGQDFVSSAPAVVVVTGVQTRTEAKYGGVARDLVNREAGHAVQNLLLQATALGLAAVPLGGFDPSAVERLLALPPGEQVLYLVPIGFPVR